MIESDYVTTRDMNLPWGDGRMVHIAEGTKVFVLYWLTEKGKPKPRTQVAISLTEYGKQFRVHPDNIRKIDA